MITVICEKFNTFDENKTDLQDLYSNFINEDLDLDKLLCSCGGKGCLTKHAYYKRKAKTILGSRTLKILRVKCSVCRCTHAIMISCIVPYSQILFNQHLEIVSQPLNLLINLMIGYDIEESHIRYIKRQYKTHWKQLITDLNIDLHLITPSFFFQELKLQFMQIRKLTNIPFYVSS